ncbi:MAG: DNA ligase D [Gemmataceae bacterium]|nr:DNA ligase D [Gemmataceae bacterium]
MGLKEYRAKRQFEETPEPQAGKPTARGSLRFCVQKHAASHLHYDFRLEVDGVLKSWAVPKGPSLNPGDKRLAMMVEDHPFDYRDFEGNIPAGNYGAGSVIVWDQGEYHAADTESREESEQKMREGLEAGRLSFVLEGEKLQGEFALVKTHGSKQKNAWLLMKKHDDFADEADVTTLDRSVISDRNLEEVAADLPAKKSATRKKKPAAKPKKPAAQKAAKTKGMPQAVKPMLATLADAAFDREGWIFEIKWDGYRAIAFVEEGSCRLVSRNQLAFGPHFNLVGDELAKLKHDVVLDGELVVVGPDGKPSFQLLQQFQKGGKGTLLYEVFDILHLDGEDLRSRPLLERKQVLIDVLKNGKRVRVSDHVEEHGIDFYEEIARQGLEGMIAKNGSSTYQEDARSLAWLKIKTKRRQEAVIGGFTEPRRSRSDLGALILGVYEGDRLVYIGHAGGGLATPTRRDLRKELDPLVQETCPFADRPKPNAPVHWVKPKLACEVEFGEWTEEGQMRHPVYIGMRRDKPATSIRRELPIAAEEAKKATPRNGKAKSKPAETGSGEGPNLTHLDKVYWPNEGFTKGDLIEYYRDIAPVMLPYLVDRAESLHRHPNGIHGPNFFQKNAGEVAPEWVETTVIRTQDSKRDIEYVLCQNANTLLYLANLGCIEMNPWSSRVGNLDNPDFLVIDLDPEEIEYVHVVEAALAVRKALDRFDCPSYCKTSGKTGLHLFVPLGGKYAYDGCRRFAEIVAAIVQKQLPKTTSIERMPRNRQERVYLDYLQNGIGKTLAAPYSVRPYPGATVSAPLKWSEVRRTLDPSRFTIRTMRRRVDKVGDLWEPVLGKGIDLEASLAKAMRAK